MIKLIFTYNGKELPARQPADVAGDDLERQIFMTAETQVRERIIKKLSLITNRMELENGLITCAFNSQKMNYDIRFTGYSKETEKKINELLSAE